jgi:hypothetical protein
VSILIHFHNGPLHDHIAEFDELPRKYSVVADNVLYRYEIEAANAQGIEPSPEGDANEVLRGVEVRCEDQ